MSLFLFLAAGSIRMFGFFFYRTAMVSLQKLSVFCVLVSRRKIFQAITAQNFHRRFSKLFSVINYKFRIITQYETYKECNKVDIAIIIISLVLDSMKSNAFSFCQKKIIIGRKNGRMLRFNEFSLFNIEGIALK